MGNAFYATPRRARGDEMKIIIGFMLGFILATYLYDGLVITSFGEQYSCEWRTIK